jgi:non-specific protein-tyrosine kinase
MSMPLGGDRSPSEFREYVRVLRRRKLFVIVPALLVVAAAIVLSVRETPMYQASAQVLVQAPTDTTAAGSGRNNQKDTGLETDRTILTSPAVIGLAVRQLATSGTQLSESYVSKHTSAHTVTGAEVMTVQFSDSDPQRAASVANAVANSYKTYKENQASQALDTIIAPIQTQVDTDKAEIQKQLRSLQHATSPSVVSAVHNRIEGLDAEVLNLESQITSLSAQYATQVQILSAATVPSSPASPNIPRNVAAAAAAGLILGVGIAFAGEALDRRVKDRNDLEKLVGVPVLGSVPMVRKWRRRPAGRRNLARADAKQSAVSEVYKSLASSVLYQASRQRLQVVMVTSPAAGEGKTTTAANLAASLASLDEYVVLVGLDLRAPRLHKIFGVPNQVGISSLLSNADGEIEDAMRAAIRETGLEGLGVLLAGPSSGDPTHLVSEFRNPMYVDALRKIARFVVIDTPPVLGVADASIVAPLVDGVIVVADAQRSVRAGLLETRQQLVNVGANVIGTVYNDFPPQDPAAYPYEYEHGYGPYEREAVAEEEPDRAGRRA